MKIKICLALILLFSCSLQIVFAQEKAISGGIVNGRATNLPKPIYSNEAKDFCASGQVKVEVLIGEDGNVVSAKAISGDELLRDSAVEAAKKAKFSPTPEIRVKIKGIVVYNFVPERKCIYVGIVNKKALNIPVPSIHPHIKIKQNTIIKVRVVIDMSGNVVRAKALETVYPFLRGAFEVAARSAKFSPTLINSPPILVNGIIVYRLKIDGTVETDIVEKNKK